MSSEDLLARLAAKKKARGAAGVTVSAPPTDEVEPVTAAVSSSVDKAPESSNADMRTTAPWAQATCKACKGLGLSSNQGVCKPCSITARSLGILAEDFLLTSGDGAVDIRRGDVLVARVPFTSEVKAADNTKPTGATDERRAMEKAAEQVSEPKATTEKATTEKPAGRGRPKKGFTMVYGVVKRGKGTIIDLSQVMQERGAALAEEWNAGSFWAIDAFKRREALAHKAEEIAESFGPGIVMVSSDQRDLLDFAAALEPFAATVYVSGVR